MHIIFYGQSFFTIQTKIATEDGYITIAIDPFDEKIGLKVPKVSADILLITHNHSDHNNKKAVLGKPFIIDCPGEYEKSGIFVKGFPAFHDNSQGKERGRIVVYKIEAEGMKLCHLGDLGQAELISEQVEQIGEVDVLFCPVGGNYTINAKQATDVISQVEPRIVIPMHYKLPGLKFDLDPVEKFLKQIGQEDLKPEKKLKISLKNLPQEETKVVMLAP